MNASPIFASVNGTKVDLSSVTFATRPAYSSERAEAFGKRPDLLQGELSVTAYRDDGSTYKFLFWVGQQKLGRKASNSEAAASNFLRAQGESNLGVALQGSDKHVTIL